MFAKTVGLDDRFDFFSWEESRPWRGLRCRAGGAAGRRTRSASTCQPDMLKQLGSDAGQGWTFFRGGFPNGLYST